MVPKIAQTTKLYIGKGHNLFKSVKEVGAGDCNKAINTHEKYETSKTDYTTFQVRQRGPALFAVVVRPYRFGKSWHHICVTNTDVIMQDYGMHKMLEHFHVQGTQKFALVC